MSIEAILSIDQGTTNSKAILLDNNGRIIGQGSAKLDINYPQSGWVEQSAEDIWQSVLNAICICIESAPEHTIVAIGLSNQRESVLAWNYKDGTPLAPAITWQCRRTTAHTESLKSAGHETEVLARTGLPLDPLFPASKIRWLSEHTAGKNRLIGTVDSWLIWKLTDGQRYATDRSNASRTQLLNTQTGHWDDELCTLFGVEAALLAETTDSQHLFGVTKAVPNIADGTPIASAIGDSHAALFGHAAFKEGEAKATFGTGSSIMMVANAFKVPTNGMTTTIAWSINGNITYALEGNILVSASLFPWASTLLGLNGNVDTLMQLAQTVNNSNGVALVPALVGLGAPHWNPEARGILTGLSFDSSPEHIAHATAMSMPLQVVDVFDAMYQQTSATSEQVYVDGGPTRNLFLMQALADLLARPVSISKDPELSALGAGMLAGLETGFWSGLDEIAALPRERVTIQPSMAEQDRMHALSAWRAAVLKCQFNSLGHS